MTISKMMKNLIKPQDNMIISDTTVMVDRMKRAITDHLEEIYDMQVETMPGTIDRIGGFKEGIDMAETVVECICNAYINKAMGDIEA